MSEEQESLSKARLTVMLDDLLSGEGKLRYTSRIPLIYNEHAPVSKLSRDIMVKPDVLRFVLNINIGILLPRGNSLGFLVGMCLTRHAMPFTLPVMGTCVVHSVYLSVLT